MIVLNTVTEALQFVDNMDGRGMIATDESEQVAYLRTLDLEDDYLIDIPQTTSEKLRVYADWLEVNADGYHQGYCLNCTVGQAREFVKQTTGLQNGFYFNSTQFMKHFGLTSVESYAILVGRYTDLGIGLADIDINNTDVSLPAEMLRRLANKYEQLG
mgnify:CR=1 FL=1